jgi:uncharacterized protein (UPF0332 family)
MAGQPEQRRVAVQNRMNEARRALGDAQFLLARRSLKGAWNRIYDGLFCAVSALALTAGIAFKSHTALTAFFRKEFVSKGIFGRELGRSMQKAFDDRAAAGDGEVPDVDEGQVDALLQEAQRFLAAVNERIGG